MTAGETFALAAVVIWLGVLTTIVVLLTRQLALLHDTLMRISAPSISLSGQTLSGTRIAPSLTTVLQGRDGTPAVLLFLSHECSGCTESTEAIASLPGSAMRNVIVICNGKPERSMLDLSPLVEKGASVVPPIHTGTAFATYSVSYVPCALLLQDTHVVDRTSADAAPQDLAQFIARAASPVHNRRERIS